MHCWCGKIYHLGYHTTFNIILSTSPLSQRFGGGEIRRHMIFAIFFRDRTRHWGWCCTTLRWLCLALPVFYLLLSLSRFPVRSLILSLFERLISDFARRFGFYEGVCDRRCIFFSPPLSSLWTELSVWLAHFPARARPVLIAKCLRFIRWSATILVWIAPWLQR